MAQCSCDSRCRRKLGVFLTVLREIRSSAGAIPHTGAAAFCRPILAREEDIRLLRERRYCRQGRLRVPKRQIGGNIVWVRDAESAKAGTSETLYQRIRARRVARRNWWDVTRVHDRCGEFFHLGSVSARGAYHCGPPATRGQEQRDRLRNAISNTRPKESLRVRFSGRHRTR